MTSIDQAAIKAIPLRMATAWSKGSGEQFTADLSDDCDFIIFDGTALHGRDNIKAFHQHLFDTVVKGTRLESDVELVRYITPQCAVVHTAVRMAFPGEEETAPSRDSMPLFVMTKCEGRWQVELLQNSPVLPMELQPFWDDYMSLSTESRQMVTSLIETLKKPKARRAPDHC